MTDWFGRKQELPKELQDLTPEQIVEKLKAGETAATKLAETAAKVTELNTKFETFGADIDTKVSAGVEAALKKLTPSKSGGDTNTNTNTELADFLTDPNRAFAQRAAPLAALTLSTASVVAKNAAREKMQRAQRNGAGKNFDGYFFDKFENEIDEFAKTCSAEQLANPLTWEHLYFNVKGRHADEIAAQLREGKLDNIIESGSTGARRQEQQTDDTKLTPLELKIAAKLGRTPEQYIEYKKKQALEPLGVNL